MTKLNSNHCLTRTISYAKEVGAIHFSTSAKLNKGINELFVNLSERMYQLSHF